MLRASSLNSPDLSLGGNPTFRRPVQAIESSPSGNRLPHALLLSACPLHSPCSVPPPALLGVLLPAPALLGVLLPAPALLEFLQNQGFIVSITSDNDIQSELLWLYCSFDANTESSENNCAGLESREEVNSMYVGEEYGLMSVLKYDADSGQLMRLPYQLSSDFLAEATGIPVSSGQPIVGILPQPYSSGNRVLIAYVSGLIVLWDVVEAQPVVVRGDKVLQLKNKVCPPNDGVTDIVDDEPSLDLEEKEISALCWASTDGSILAMGYVDGDILFWNIGYLLLFYTGWTTLNPVSTEKVNFLYGGDEIGSEEVVTVLSLEWSSGMEAVRCTGRTDVTLNGSFADMIIVPTAGTTGNSTHASLFVLSNPGCIRIYSSELQPGKNVPVSAVNFPATIPTVDPLITVAELFYVNGSTEGLGLEIAVASPTLTLPGNKRWSLTGGVINPLSLGKDYKVQKLYVAGYDDGSVRIWDVTYPVFSPLCVLTNEANSEDLVDSGGSLTTVDLCSSTLRLAVANECGRVEIYELCSSNETTIHFVTETKTEGKLTFDLQFLLMAHVIRNISAQVQEPRCGAVFNLHKSGVQALKFINQGSRLIVVHESSRLSLRVLFQIAVVNVQSSSVAFITDSLQTSPVISVAYKAFEYEMPKKRNESAPIIPERGESIFVLTKEGGIYVIDGNNGSMISSRPIQLKKSTAISLHFIENQTTACSFVDEQPNKKDDILKNEPLLNVDQRSEKCKNEDHALDKNPSTLSLKELLILVCCRDKLLIYPAKSVVQGQSKYIYKVKLSKPCCWTSVFRTDHVGGLAVFYQTGEMEIRFPAFFELHPAETVAFIRILYFRIWCSGYLLPKLTVNGTLMQIFALSGIGERIFFTVTVKVELQAKLGKDDQLCRKLTHCIECKKLMRFLFSWIPESLPSLHDEVLATAANAAISISSDRKRKKRANPGILGGIVKGLRAPKPNNADSSADYGHLEEIFERNIIPGALSTADEPEAIELTIDDIDIDEPGPSTSASPHELDKKNKDTKTERQKLFDDDVEIKPRVRTREEIIATYRKTEDASSAAGQAKNKLMERQEKLEVTYLQKNDPKLKLFVLITSGNGKQEVVSNIETFWKFAVENAGYEGRASLLPHSSMELFFLFCKLHNFSKHIYVKSAYMYITSE
ncbi:hypothetical protein SASPL_111906 [Salvia splendens]|uniref:Transducin family protein / WD-40 repeat family protein n=1 Tax=Salvia splendens TaxID=180675 RepID=A0A8X8Y8Z2_SALSN|nr:hypothetical protein SASPL_111906 [Salvia splendens]